MPTVFERSESKHVEKTRQRLWEAASLIAMGTGPMRERLHLVAERLTHVNPEKLPEQLRRDFAKVLVRLRDDELVASYSDAESNELAETVLHIYAEMHNSEGAAH